MAQFLTGFRMFCSLGLLGPVVGGVVMPLIPFSPINIVVYLILFGLIYGINHDFNKLNQKDNKRNLGISLRNAFFIYLPCMCLMMTCFMYTACKAAGK